MFVQTIDANPFARSSAVCPHIFCPRSFFDEESEGLVPLLELSFFDSCPQFFIFVYSPQYCLVIYPVYPGYTLYTSASQRHQCGSPFIGRMSSSRNYRVTLRSCRFRFLLVKRFFIGINVLLACSILDLISIHSFGHQDSYRTTFVPRHDC